jgi:hypothetical protein
MLPSLVELGFVKDEDELFDSYAIFGGEDAGLEHLKAIAC